MSYYNAIPDYIEEGEWTRRITTKLVVSVTNDDNEERRVLEAIKEFEVPKPVSPLPSDEEESEEITA